MYLLQSQKLSSPSDSELAPGPGWHFACSFLKQMKDKIRKSHAQLCSLGLCLLLAGIAAVRTQAQQNKPVITPATVNVEADKQAISVFEGRVKEYVSLRNQVKDKLPKLSKDSTAEQIDAYRTSLEKALRVARGGAKQGDIFVPAIAEYLRRTLRNEFDRKDKKDFREIIFEAETQGVPIRVNYPYPSAAEIAQLPPTLLLKLPQLQQELRYRFVGRNMLLVDRENNLILDYLTNALP